MTPRISLPDLAKNRKAGELRKEPSGKSNRSAPRRYGYILIDLPLFASSPDGTCNYRGNPSNCDSSGKTARRIARLHDGGTLFRVFRHAPSTVNGTSDRSGIVSYDTMDIGFRHVSLAAGRCVASNPVISAVSVRWFRWLRRFRWNLLPWLPYLEHADRLPAVNVPPERADGRVGGRGARSLAAEHSD